MPDFTKLDAAYAAWDAADKAWMAELTRIHGKNAGDVRYEGRGKGAAGTELRRLYDAADAGRRAWEVEKDALAVGVQPDPRAAAMVSEAADLLEQYGDHALGDL